MFSQQIKAASTAIAGFGKEYLDTYADGDMKMSLVRVEQIVSAFVAEIEEMNSHCQKLVSTDLRENGLCDCHLLGSFIRHAGIIDNPFPIYLLQIFWNNQRHS